LRAYASFAGEWAQAPLCPAGKNCGDQLVVSTHKQLQKNRFKNTASKAKNPGGQPGFSFPERPKSLPN
jgi:hypothetical protein